MLSSDTAIATAVGADVREGVGGPTEGAILVEDITVLGGPNSAADLWWAPAYARSGYIPPTQVESQEHRVHGDLAEQITVPFANIDCLQ